MMHHRYIAIVTVFILIVPFSSTSSGSFDISDPEYTNQIIEEINTPSIEPGEDGIINLIIKNPDTEDENSVMQNTTFEVEIYYYDYLDVEKNISELDEPPVFDTGEVALKEEIGNLSTKETHDLEYLIHTSEDTEEGVYSIRFRLEFSIDDERHIMKSKGHFSNEEWEDARVSDFTELNVSGILPESTFEVRTPIPRWPQYALGLITIVAGVLAVMFYMQEKYGSFPKLEKTFDNWTSKFEEFRSTLKKRFKKR